MECPECGFDLLDVETHDDDDWKYVWHSFRCLECGHTWDDLGQN